MYIVKVGDQPYVGMDLGVWEKRDGAVGCAERYIKNSAYFVEWVKNGEDKWSCTKFYEKIQGIIKIKKSSKRLFCTLKRLELFDGEILGLNLKLWLHRYRTPPHSFQPKTKLEYIRKEVSIF